MPQTPASPPLDASVDASVDALVDPFLALGLSPALARAATASGYSQPTAIQTSLLPPALAGRDVLGLAPTGSGKTAAFLLPLLQAVWQTLLTADVDQRPRPLLAVVLAPTRELANQTAAVARKLCEHLVPALKTQVAVGGLSINPQLMALRGGTHVLVATPGRLLDLHAHNALHLQQVQVLVLDEADRLLDAGFAVEVQRVLALLPPQRQNLLLSATLDDAARDWVATVLREPVLCDVRSEVRSEVREAATGDFVLATEHAATQQPTAQRAIVVHSTQRTPLLRHLMATLAWQKVLVFVATQHASEQVASKLRHTGLPAAALHGQLSQGRRAQVLADFEAGHLAVLVATDLAARGLDLAHLHAVVNHDLPRSADAYTHRIGRVGRLLQSRGGAAQQPAVAVSFVLADAPGSEAHFRLIEKRQQQRVPREQLPGFEAAGFVVNQVPALNDEANAETAGLVDNNGGVKGRRPSKKDKLRAAAAAGVVPAAVPARFPALLPAATSVTPHKPAPKPAAPVAPAPPRPDSRNVADVMAEWRARNPR